MKERYVSGLTCTLALVASLIGGCNYSEKPTGESGVPQVEAQTQAGIHESAVPRGEMMTDKQAAGKELLIADFDSGQKPNLIGGDFGSWNKDPSDTTQQCAIAFDADGAFGNKGYSLRIDYDVDSPNPAYNGFWMKLQNIDISPYSAVTVALRGDAAKGFTNQVKLEIKNGAETGRYLLQGITGEWQKFRIPLADFAGLTDLKGLTEFVIVFDDITSTQKVGALYLDEVAFE